VSWMEIWIEIHELDWDPGRLSWNATTNFLSYAIQFGRELLRKRHPPLQLAASKWSLNLPQTFVFDWSEVWDTEGVRKEAGLIWRLWHKAFAVNTWRGRILEFWPWWIPPARCAVKTSKRPSFTVSGIVKCTASLEIYDLAINQTG
jgi:hypothetical protein